MCKVWWFFELDRKWVLIRSPVSWICGLLPMICAPCSKNQLNTINFTLKHKQVNPNIHNYDMKPTQKNTITFKCVLSSVIFRTGSQLRSKPLSCSLGSVDCTSWVAHRVLKIHRIIKLKPLPLITNMPPWKFSQLSNEN